MRKVKNIALMLCTLAVITVAFSLPNKLLEHSDRKNDKVEINKLDAITLNIEKDISLFRKMYIWKQGTKIETNKAESSRDLVENTAIDFLNSIEKNTDTTDIFRINSITAEQLLSIIDDTESVIVWSVSITLDNEMYLFLVIDDETMQILELELYFGDNYSECVVYDKTYFEDDVGKTLLSSYSEVYGKQIDLEFIDCRVDEHLGKTNLYKFDIEEDGKKYTVYVRSNDFGLFIGQLTDDECFVISTEDDAELIQ